ncbi:transposase [Alloalcanivorax marinus]|uniref:transposase n=1 Tax=Alloalcanivorax marinus TaxID=1177169 RepID=UPI0021D084D4|nr:transposase [Alloalcanivorax marinus]MCU5788090.1 transposase [Alloalcanivorax marinus]
MAKKQRHAYTEEFRREAVRRSDQSGNTAASVAKELGLHPYQIYNWRRQFSRLSEKQFNSLSGVDYSQQESEEVRRLKRELHAARKENEFLKKAAAYFAKLQE